eukprot:Nitzschia sp. Nitz4//scaffold8_size234185//167436//169205//NITZ4_001281-RA/size234185-processed-gene-0.342-mRNA-1//1//CDS//3329559878//3750//frame0
MSPRIPARLLPRQYVLRWTQDNLSPDRHGWSSKASFATASGADTDNLNPVGIPGPTSPLSAPSAANASSPATSSGNMSTPPGMSDAANLKRIDPENIRVMAWDSTNQEARPEKVEPYHAHFVEMFRGSANYIATHRDSLVVYHIPGNVVDHPDPKVFRNLMNDISLTWLLGLKIVIVVGCQHQVDRRMINRKRHMGMAITDPETLRVVKEEAGYVRFEVERQLARALQGSRSRHGLDGNVVSGNFYSAQPFGVLNGVDYQYSGFVRRFEKEKIERCHDSRDIVLLNTLGFSPTGEVFNVNSEYLAAHAGGLLGAAKVMYFLEHDVDLLNEEHDAKIPHLRTTEAKHLLAANHISIDKERFIDVQQGCDYHEKELSLLVKIGWAMHALGKGVQRVHMVSPERGALLEELYTRDGAGTMVSADVYDGIRRATINDVNGVHELISPLIQRGTLVDRPKAVLERDISQYHVYTRDDLIVACGQLKMFENGYAEIGCLVVNPKYRASGRGDAMLAYLERLCILQGVSQVFVLSTQTMEWFVERGFDSITVDKLPPSRQATYNPSRASKIYMKKIASERDLDASELFWSKPSKLQ